MNRIWLIKSDEETNEEYGKRPDERTIEESIHNSIIIVDKHAGPTSHQITDWIKKIFNVKKAGHGGTLDPFATGVLPVALENSTKIMPALLGLKKEYVGIIHLHKEISEDTLEKAIRKFIGKIKQMPPVKSAVARRMREKEVYFFDVLEKDNKDIIFKIGCEAGTYIRKIAHDLGLALGTGAHLTELRRTKAGNFDESNAHSLTEIKDAYELWNDGDEKGLRKILIPVEHAIKHIKKVFVKDSAIHSICNGSPIYVNGITRIQKGIERGELIAVYSLKEELVAIGIAKLTSEEMLKRKRGTAVRTDRVLMDKGVYPKLDSKIK